MSSRRAVALLGCMSSLSIAACGAGGDGFACTGSTCKASFQGTGEQDLSSLLGEGATVEIRSVADAAAVVRVAGREATIERTSRSASGASR